MVITGSRSEKESESCKNDKNHVQVEIETPIVNGEVCCGTGKL